MNEPNTIHVRNKILKTTAPHTVIAGGAAVSFMTGTRHADVEAHEAKIDNIVKNEFKRVAPRLYYFARHLFCPGLLITNSPKKMLKKYVPGRDGLILNIGSASDIIRDDVVNLDIIHTPNVDIVADGCNLPLESQQCEVIISDMTLEHVPQVQKMVAEIDRLLKPGGLVYVSVPFMTPYHSAPGDYYRWTKQGLPELFPGYQVLEVDGRDGPASGLAYLLVDFFALLFSFGVSWLHKINIIIFLIVFSPVKLLDFILIHFPDAHKASGMVYLIAKKPTSV